MKIQIILAGAVIAGFLVVTVGPSLNTSCLDDAGSAAYHDDRVAAAKAIADRNPDLSEYKAIAEYGAGRRHIWKRNPVAVCRKYVSWLPGTDTQ